MGLFSVLTEATGTGTGQVPGDGRGTSSSTNNDNSGLPTVLQLYAGTTTPIQLEDTSMLSAYSILTYQAIQIGSQEDEELKNRHQTPDLGVWNCRVTASSSQNKEDVPLVDALLGTMATKLNTFVMTVDLDDKDPAQVEPTVTMLQNALVRFLIEHPPPVTPDYDEDEDAAADSTSPPQKRQTATTSLYQLQSVEFGKANDDSSKKETRDIDESFQNIYTTLMICVKLSNTAGTEEEHADAYKQKQAQALVLYHLRKFAAALNCSLCFVQAPVNTKEHHPQSPTKESQNPVDASSTVSSSTTTSLQPTTDYATLSQWWRDLALDQAIWESSSLGAMAGDALVNKTLRGDAASGDSATATTPETVIVATPLYGPGNHQEDLIESVVLRSANYPGHWDAQKDSLWVALPAPKDAKEGSSATAATSANAGDAGWLGQLRESIASANDLPPPASVSPEKRAAGEGGDKDAEVSDFFASLLKKP